MKFKFRTFNAPKDGTNNENIANNILKCRKVLKSVSSEQSEISFSDKLVIQNIINNLSSEGDKQKFSEFFNFLQNEIPYIINDEGDSFVLRLDFLNYDQYNKILEYLKTNLLLS